MQAVHTGKNYGLWNLGSTQYRLQGSAPTDILDASSQVLVWHCRDGYKLDATDSVDNLPGFGILGHIGAYWDILGHGGHRGHHPQNERVDLASRVERRV